MFEYRVTKYDPKFRDTAGAYTRDEWIMFSQVGSEVAGEVLSLAAYEKIEQSYIDSAIFFLKEAGVRQLLVNGFENNRQTVSGKLFREGLSLEHDALRAAFKSVLREEFWSRFEDDSGSFVHFGWDYYMYIGVLVPCVEAIAQARQSGLFVEEFRSPYHQE